MRKTIVGLCVLFSVAVLGAVSVAAWGAPSPEARFKELYPSVKYSEIQKSAIDGLYEVMTDNNVFYFHPGTGYLIFGEMLRSDFSSITGERRSAVAFGGAESGAVRIGTGKRIVYEITDPDCPYCRKAADFFHGRPDVTRYVFFNPLTQLHPDAEKKALYILCAADREAAYRAVYSGQFDGKEVPACADGKAYELLAAHKQVAQKTGASGTPAFYVGGRLVQGANIPLLTKLLDDMKPVVKGGDSRE